MPPGRTRREIQNRLLYGPAGYGQHSDNHLGTKNVYLFGSVAFTLLADIKGIPNNVAAC